MTSFPPPEVGVHGGAGTDTATTPPGTGGGSAPPIGERRRVGQLTVAWQIMGAVAWAAAFFAFAGVWKASEEIGIATWWLGPRADAQPMTIRIVPFVLCVFLGLWAIYNVRGFPWASLAGSAGVAAIAVFDVSRSVGLAAAEFAIAGALAMVSLASFGGRYRAGAAPPAAQAGDPQSPPTEPPSPGAVPTDR